jgi:hypothetical protein
VPVSSSEGCICVKFSSHHMQKEGCRCSEWPDLTDTKPGLWSTRMSDSCLSGYKSLSPVSNLCDSYNCHNVLLYHSYLFTEISFLWETVNVSVQTSRLSFHCTAVKSPMVFTGMPPSQFHCLALRSSGMPFVFSPTVPLLHVFLAKSPKY